MKEDFEKVIALVKHLGLDPDVNEYKDRFILQKITFIAQSLGINFNYVFTPYAAGPYSTILADDYYSYNSELASRSTNYRFEETEIQSINKITDYCDFNGNLSQLEATSTFVYIMRDGFSTDDEINREFKSLKPYISNTKRIKGMTKAKQLMFKEEYLTEELKREQDVWDSLE